jgi:uncharacterized coiled-coil protein SlyX
MSTITRHEGNITRLNTKVYNLEQTVNSMHAKMVLMAQELDRNKELLDDLKKEYYYDLDIAKNKLKKKLRYEKNKKIYKRRLLRRTKKLINNKRL